MLQRKIFTEICVLIESMFSTGMKFENDEAHGQKMIKNSLKFDVLQPSTVHGRWIAIHVGLEMLPKRKIYIIKSALPLTHELLGRMA